MTVQQVTPLIVSITNKTRKKSIVKVLNQKLLPPSLGGLCSILPESFTMQFSHKNHHKKVPASHQKIVSFILQNQWASSVLHVKAGKQGKMT